MKLVDSFEDAPMKASEEHQYMRYRLGRLKHQLWLTNRKNPEVFKLDSYDRHIVSMLKPGRTCIFGSAGYYLDDIIDDLTVIEMHPIVQKFWPACKIVSHRDQIAQYGPFDNFIVTNNRGDHWVTVDGLTDHLLNYAASIVDKGLLFYSFRDTQINNWNRLTLDHYEHFHTWAVGLKEHGLTMLSEDIKFSNGINWIAGEENPDVLNGNLKFIFQVDKTAQI